MTQRRYQEGYEASRLAARYTRRLLQTPADIAANPNVSDQVKSMFTKYKAMQKMKSMSLKPGRFEDVRKSLAGILDGDDYKFDLGGNSKKLVNLFDLSDTRILDILANPEADENIEYMEQLQKGWKQRHLLL